MIMVLSCSDLLTVLTNNPLLALIALLFLKMDKYFPRFFIIRSFGDEFRSIFGDILSYFSSNLGIAYEQALKLNWEPASMTNEFEYLRLKSWREILSGQML
jgi:hypothetical protein